MQFEAFQNTPAQLLIVLLLICSTFAILVFFVTDFEVKTIFNLRHN